MDYLLEYIKDFELDYLKEQYVEEILDLLVLYKENVKFSIEKLKKENGDADIYLELSENINKFIRGE